jgi:hypothetical protein
MAMTNSTAAFEKAIRLAAVTGLRSMLGPALVAASRGRPERQALAAAAMGEMIIDKVPLVPSRSSLIGVVPRALAGAWVAKTTMEEEGENDPWAPAVGAAVAVGVGMCAPLIRGALRRALGVPDAAVGLAEDYLALRVGSQAVGLSMDDLKQIAGSSVEDVKERVMPAVESLSTRAMP